MAHGAPSPLLEELMLARWGQEADLDAARYAAGLVGEPRCAAEVLARLTDLMGDVDGLLTED